MRSRVSPIVLRDPSPPHLSLASFVQYFAKETGDLSAVKRVRYAIMPVMSWWKHIISVPQNDQEKKQVTVRMSNASRKEKIEKGAEDFAVRFEDVMRDLAKG